MNSQFASLSWRYWKQAKSHLTAICGFFLIGVGLVAIGWLNLENPGMWTSIFGALCLIAACTPALFQTDQRNLPISSTKIAAILSGNAFVFAATAFLVIAVARNLFTEANFLILKPAILAGGTAVFVAGVYETVRRLVISDDDGSTELIWFVALVASSLFWLLPEYGAKFHEAIQWTGLILIPAVGFLLQVTAIHRSRVEKNRPFDFLNKKIDFFNLLGAGKATLYRSASRAVVDLDWKRLRVVVVAGTALASLLFFILPFFADGMSGTFVALAAPGFVAFGYIIPLQFMENDQKMNGDFRWTLPVSDNTIASGLLRNVAWALIVCWSVGALLFAAASLMLYLIGRLPLEVADGQGDDAGGADVATLSGHIKFAAIAGIAALALGWIAATNALEISIWGRSGCVTSVGIWVSLGAVAVLNWMFVPEQAQSIIWQILLVACGLLLILRAGRAATVSIRFERMKRTTCRWLFALWCTASLIGVAILAYLEFASIGHCNLLAGLFALMLHPFAGIPNAVLMQRHFC